MQIRLFSIILLFCFFLVEQPAIAQNEMFKQKKERKKLWRRWKKNREAYNPYLDKKAKNKPSARMARGDKKELRRQKRIAKKQMRRNKKTIAN